MIPSVLLPGNDLEQGVHTRASVTKQYNLESVIGQWCSAAGKVTVGPALLWPCVTDFSGLSTYRLRAWVREMSRAPPPNTSRGVWYTLPSPFFRGWMKWAPSIDVSLVQSPTRTSSFLDLKGVHCICCVTLTPVYSGTCDVCVAVTLILHSARILFTWSWSINYLNLLLYDIDLILQNVFEVASLFHHPITDAFRCQYTVAYHYPRNMHGLHVSCCLLWLSMLYASSWPS